MSESKPSDHRLRGICQKDVEKGASTRKIWNPLGFKKNYSNSVRPEKNPQSTVILESEERKGSFKQKNASL